MSALAEAEQLGSREFLSRYRFGRTAAYTLWHGGQEFDSKAILGVAYLHATGRAATRDDFNEGLGKAMRYLQELGFDVAIDELELEHEERKLASRTVAPKAEPRASTPRTSTPRTSTRAPAKPKAAPKKAVVERPVNVCPNCYMAIPATGLCDNCD